MNSPLPPPSSSSSSLAASKISPPSSTSTDSGKVKTSSAHIALINSICMSLWALSSWSLVPVLILSHAFACLQNSVSYITVSMLWTQCDTSIGSVMLNSFLYGIFLSTFFFCYHVSKWQNEKNNLLRELSTAKIMMSNANAQLTKLQDAASRVVLAPTTLDAVLNSQPRGPSFHIM